MVGVSKYMKKYKQIKGYAVMILDKNLLPNPTLIDFIFRTKQQAIGFRGKLEADIVRVVIRQVNK
jgi:hypothetical protein